MTGRTLPSCGRRHAGGGVGGWHGAPGCGEAVEVDGATAPLLANGVAGENWRTTWLSALLLHATLQPSVGCSEGGHNLCEKIAMSI